jgi:hypothetical protein
MEWAVLDGSHDGSLYWVMALAGKNTWVLCRGGTGVGASATLLAVLLSALLLACSSKDARYPEDHARFNRIDAAMESLRRGYVEKNMAQLQGIMLPLDQLERLLAEITKDFDAFKEISLDFAIDRILVEGDTIDVFVHWQGEWKRTPGDAGIRERGHGMLRWVGIHSILLSRVEGDLPFGMALRHADNQPSPSRS